MAKKEEILISVVFPNWNGEKDCIDYLTSIKKSSFYPNKLEVILVDNGSTDRSVKNIHKKYPFVKIIELKKNLGASVARNVGFKLSKGKFLFSSDNDIILQSKTLEYLLEAMENKKVGIAGPKVIKKGKNKIIESAGGYGFNKWFGTIYDYPDSKSIQECEFVIGCGMLIRSKILKKIGFFDETYLKYFEDADLCLRAKSKGFKIIYQPKAILYHGKSKTTSDLSLNQKFYSWYKNQYNFCLKHCSIFQTIFIFTCQLSLAPIIKQFYLNKKQKMPNLLVDYYLRLKAFIFNIAILNKTLQKRRLI